MRFTVSSEAIDRLGLSPELKEREFNGPQIERGALTGFTTAERRYAKRELLQVEQMQDVDLTDIWPVYYFLTVKRADPRLLPQKRFVDLAETDFDVVPHAYAGELSQCQECGAQVRAVVHDVPEDTPPY